MEEQFIPYELAIELRILGFDDYGFAFYWTDTKQLIFDSPDYLGKHNGVHLQAPLWQQAFDWFRKEKGFDSWVVPIHYIENGKSFKKYTYIIEPVIFDETFSIDGTESENYEEARIECLKKLIELRKNVK